MDSCRLCDDYVKCCGKPILYVKAQSRSTTDIQKVLKIVTYTKVQVGLVAAAMTLMYFLLAEWSCAIVSRMSGKSIFGSKYFLFFLKKVIFFFLSHHICSSFLSSAPT